MTVGLWTYSRIVGLLFFSLTSLGASELVAQTKPFLSMPGQINGALPQRLSETGAFKDTRRLETSAGLLPYDLNVPFWSDGASKLRWIALPESQSSTDRIKFAPTGEWTFPHGTVFVKHFELALDETRPTLKRRLETRLLVCNSTGGVYGVSYKWRSDNGDADLLSTNLTETILIKTVAGTRTQTWYYPSREDCLICHTRNAGGVLGVNTRQLNGDFAIRSDITNNQLQNWSRFGFFDTPVGAEQLSSLPRLARLGDTRRSIEDRARSYLDANCAHCHRPNGTVANFDARYDTPLANQNLINGHVLIDEGIDGARAIAPNDTWRSIVLMRTTRLDGTRMPPLAHSELDHGGVELLKQWIGSLPGPPVLSPPTITPGGGDFKNPIEVSLSHSEPGATIRYTTDGSVPTEKDPLYEKPFRISRPTVLRAKAFRSGFTRSITAQQIFIVGS